MPPAANQFQRGRKELELAETSSVVVGFRHL